MTDISKRARSAMAEKLCREDNGELPESRMMSGITIDQLENVEDYQGEIDGIQYMLDATKDVLIRRSDFVSLLNKARSEAALEQPAEGVEPENGCYFCYGTRQVSTVDQDGVARKKWCPKCTGDAEIKPDNPTPPEGELMEKDKIAKLCDLIRNDEGPFDWIAHESGLQHLEHTARAAHIYRERCEELEHRNTDTACERDHFFFEHESTLEAFDRESSRLREAKDRITALEAKVERSKQEIKSFRALVAELERERDEISGRFDQQVAHWKDENQALQSQLTKVQEALRFYANGNNYEIFEGCREISEDAGSRARAALKEGE